MDEQHWKHLVYVEVNSLLNRADQARRYGKPQTAAALEWCSAAIRKAADVEFAAMKLKAAK